MGSLRTLYSAGVRERKRPQFDVFDALAFFLNRYMDDQGGAGISCDEVRAHFNYMHHLNLFASSLERLGNVSISDEGKTILVMLRSKLGLSGYTVQRYSGDIYSGGNVVGSIFKFK